MFILLIPAKHTFFILLVASEAYEIVSLVNYTLLEHATFLST